MIEVDINLIKKYERPGPRYTSYPTALHFSESFTHAEYIDELVRNNRHDNNLPLSLYFHIPFCDTLCYFCGCNTIISQNRNRINKYVSYLKEEIEILMTYINREREVIQLHWGGGTPTHLFPEEIVELKSFINSHFKISPSAEQSCEIDPRGLTENHIKALRESGFNRLSLGVQDFNPDVQKAVNRIQSEEITLQAVEWIRKYKFDSLNLDLIYGLPYQSRIEFEKTIDKIIQISPERIALFNFAYVPWMKPHMKLIDEKAIPSAGEKLEILKMSIEKLTTAGYVFIGMDHFAKPEDELSIAFREKKLHRNFQGYSTNAGADLYALGLTSISQIENFYSQNYKDEENYFGSIDKGMLPVHKGYIMNQDDKIRRYVIMKIMCDFSLDFEATGNLLGIDFNSYFEKSIAELDEMIKDNLLEISSNKMTVTEKGRLFIRNIAMCFDAYIERDTSRYSKTV